MQNLSRETIPVISADVVARLPIYYQAVLKVAADRHDVVIVKGGDSHA